MKRVLFQLFLFVILFGPFSAQGASVFAKGSISRTYTDVDEETLSISATGGLSFSLLPFLRIEGRYTNITSVQNRVEINSGTVSHLSNHKTQSDIYSLGIDLSLFGRKSTFQPFIYLGGGYLIATRTYDVNFSDGSSISASSPKQEGLSVNVGAGFRMQIARSLAFEVEVFGVSRNIREPNPLVNLYGNVGIRIFI